MPRSSYPLNPYHIMQIYCKNISKYLPVEGGETLAEIAARLAAPLGSLKPICALVNNKTEPLHYQVYGPKQVEFLSAQSRAGEKVYIRSLCMMLYCAVAKAYPGMRLRIEHSIAGGYYCRLFEDSRSVDALRMPAIITRLLEDMRSLAARSLPFERKERLTSDIIGEFRAEGLNDKVQLLETIHELYTVYYRLDGVADSYYGPLAPDTGCISVFDLVPYKEGFLLMGFDKSDPSVPAVPFPQEKMYEAYIDYLHFNDVLGIRNVGQLNRAVEEKRSASLINVAEALHDKKIAAIADEITSR